MNHEAISQVCIAQVVTAGPAIAASPAGLLAHLEDLCLQALSAQLAGPHEQLLGTSVKLTREAPLALGARLEITGFVCGLGDQSVRLQIEVRSGPAVVAEAQLGFVLRPAPRPPTRPSTAAAPSPRASAAGAGAAHPA